MENTLCDFYSLVEALQKLTRSLRSSFNALQQVNKNRMRASLFVPPPPQVALPVGLTKKKRKNERTSERTKERKNELTNELTKELNEPTNARTPIPITSQLSFRLTSAYLICYKYCFLHGILISSPKTWLCIYSFSSQLLQISLFKKFIQKFQYVNFVSF